MSNEDKTIREIINYLIIILIVFTVTQHLNVVVSGSMEPVFARGDVIAVEKTDFFGINEFNSNNIKVGDIVVYNAKWYDQPVTHRVISITEINGTTYYLIKGDNNNLMDPYLVTGDQITQRVLTIGDQPIVIPSIGYINLWFRGL